MWLILCSSDDKPALWAYQNLKALGLAPLQLVTAEMLACSLRWQHSLGKNGANVAIGLADGCTIHSGRVRGVLNRLTSIPMLHLQIAKPGDREYAAQELTAFFTSWLYALPPPVLNQPTPQGLCGSNLHASEWIALAARAGLPTAKYSQTSRQPLEQINTDGKFVPRAVPTKTLIAVGRHVVGHPASRDMQQGCCRLAQLSRTALLGIHFSLGRAGAWTFAGATPFPDLRLGGRDLIAALAKEFLGEGEGGA